MNQNRIYLAYSRHMCKIGHDVKQCKDSSLLLVFQNPWNCLSDNFAALLSRRFLSLRLAC